MSQSQERNVVATFDAVAPRYASKYEAAAGHSFVTRRRRIGELLDGLGRGRLLDVGCGPGVMVEEARARGLAFHGVDISKEMIAQCQQHFGHLHDVQFQVGKIEALEYPDDHFDVVVCMGVVEYLDDADLALREMARVLRPGGSVLITAPNRWSPFRMAFRWMMPRPLVNFVRRLRGRSGPSIVHREFMEGALRRRLAAHGLSVVDFVYYNFKLVPFPLDHLLPGLTSWSSRGLERLCRGSLRWLGTGFIVRADKAVKSPRSDPT